MLNYLVSKLVNMKKINKKLLVIGLIILFSSLALVALVKAQVDPLDFFRVNSASMTPEGVKQAGVEGQEGPAVKVINRSGKDYFVPNKTPSEFESFKENAPNYVSVSVCGDGVGGTNTIKTYKKLTFL
jgi:hypothetical protein